MVPVLSGHSDHELLTYGVPREWLADVRNANEDTLLTIVDHLPAEAAEALLELACGGVPRLPQATKPATDPFAHPDALRRFRVMNNVEELQRALDFPWEKWTIFLHPAQRQLVERDYSGPARVAGPAGTGKTYLAVAMAISALLAKRVNRIILARPAVEAGERLGFLPGTLQDKIDPYLRPLYDALYDMLDPEKVDRYLEKNVIEIAPIAFMRGRTLNDSFVILDEAQNTTSEQMKMFVTRLGFNSKAVITGDVTQIDLPNARRSGLLEAVDVLKHVEGLAFVHFDEGDVVRHHLVQRIVRAYDEHKARVAEQQMLLLAESKGVESGDAGEKAPASAAEERTASAQGKE
jgi:hypothetical protein